MTTTSKSNQKKTALVTGGSAGIGLELAKQLAAHGHDLILVARHRDALEAAAGTLEGKYGVKVMVIASDLADPASPQRLFDAVTAEGKRVDFLINNAGFGLGGEFSDTDLDRELDMIQVNIAALTHLAKLFLPAMLQRREGRVMNVASTAAFQPGPLMAVYYATKAYVLSFSQALAEELRNSDVTVTCLCPGATATHFAKTAGTSNSRLFTRLGVAAADDVARYGYAAMMRGTRVAIPGVRDRIMVQAERIAPRALVTKLARMAQENR
ncbi:MAG: SDR family oxidoreductase [Gemmatimonadaceae bacterium]|nr:SDR family oxidoreductase [Gemmatimonadaceae bacterium]